VIFVIDNAIQQYLPIITITDAIPLLVNRLLRLSNGALANRRVQKLLPTITVEMGIDYRYKGPLHLQ